MSDLSQRGRRGVRPPQPKRLLWRRRLSRGRGPRRRLPLAAVAVALPVLLSLAAAGPDDGSSSRPAISPPERVMAELRAANAARAQLLQAEQDWALNKQKLELLKATVLREAERLTSAAAAARREEAELNRRLADARATQQRLEQVEAMVDALAERLEKALEKLAARALPGLVPPDRAAGITEPIRRLMAGAERLNQTERQARACAVELVTGTQAGKPVTVKLLRAGGVAAWWIALDGDRTGVAALTDGRLILLPPPRPTDGDAIRKAFAIAEGRVAPAWVLLPLHPQRQAESAGGPP